MQKLTDKIKQHVSNSIRKKCNIVREQPPRMCKNNNPKMNCDSAIGQHVITNPLSKIVLSVNVLESVYIKTRNLVLCKQTECIFTLGLFK